MLEIVRKPNTYYGKNYILINQSGLTQAIWDYYWTSYSRGTDGTNGNPLPNNEYLNGYNQQRSKSIYDPCPYGFRVPTNGTYNLFPKSYVAWKPTSYVGGVKFLSTWLNATGNRDSHSAIIVNIGSNQAYRTSILGYALQFGSGVVLNQPNWSSVYAPSVRCIED